MGPTLNSNVPGHYQGQGPLACPRSWHKGWGNNDLVKSRRAKEVPFCPSANAHYVSSAVQHWQSMGSKGNR